MAGIETGMDATASRVLALRRLAARSGAGADEPPATRLAGRRGGPGSGSEGHASLVGELLVGWIVAALVTAAVVGFGAAIIPTEEPGTAPIPATNPAFDSGAELDPNHPLVICTVFEEFIKCAIEPT